MHTSTVHDIFEIKLRTTEGRVFENTLCEVHKREHSDPFVQNTRYTITAVVSQENSAKCRVCADVRADTHGWELIRNGDI